MTFISLEPEVPGELGSETQLDAATHPPVVERLHLDLTNWLGDELVECFPCFAVSRRLADALQHSGLSGFSLTTMKTTVNPDQQELNPVQDHPDFQRLMVSGQAGIDDLGLDPSFVLVASPRMFLLLQEFSLKHCDREPWGA